MAKKPKKVEPRKKKESYNAKMIVIAIIFVMIFVSFAVIITTQEGTDLSKNMVFSQDNEEPGRYYGNVRDVNVDLSFIKLKIKEDSSSISNETNNLVHETTLDTEGNFTCTYFDRNSNGKLDPSDEFEVENADEGDKITISYKSSDSVIAFYIFSEPF
jgi:hypothetical protein